MDTLRRVMSTSVVLSLVPAVVLQVRLILPGHTDTRRDMAPSRDSSFGYLQLRTDGYMAFP